MPGYLTVFRRLLRPINHHLVGLAIFRTCAIIADALPWGTGNTPLASSACFGHCVSFRFPPLSSASYVGF